MKNRLVVSLFLLVLFLTPFVSAQQEGSREGSKEGSAPGSESQEESVVLKGLDPVALVQGKKEKGQETHSTVHEGFRYHFANVKNKSEFESKPDQYAVYPLDVVAKTRLNQEIKGKPDLFAVHEGQIFLFASEDARKVFEKNPSQFAASAKREGSGPGAPEGSAPRR